MKNKSNNGKYMKMEHGSGNSSTAMNKNQREIQIITIELLRIDEIMSNTRTQNEWDEKFS